MPTVSVIKNNEDGSPSSEKEGSFQAQENETLWESADAQGLQLPAGCLSGACAACRIEVLSGADQLTPMGPTEEATLERFKTNYAMRPNAKSLDGVTLRLSCQAKTVGNGDIDIAPFN